MSGLSPHCSSHSLWSYTATQPERPAAPVLHSTCTHAPLQSIAAIPAVVIKGAVVQPVDPTALPQQPSKQQHGGLLHQLPAQGQTQTHQQCQQPLDEFDAMLTPRSDTRQPKPVSDVSLQRLFTAARYQLPLQRADLLELMPVLPALPASRLSQAVEALSMLPDAPALIATIPEVSVAILVPARELFAAGCMGERSASRLLQALVKLQIQPEPAWLQQACVHMDVSGWRGSRALATVAACLPQLGHVPSSSWASVYFDATAVRIQALPAISLARMLHGVVAWRHLQQQQQQQQAAVLQQGNAAEAQLEIPELWLTQILQQLYLCSSQLKPCEVAMVLQTLQRLQRPDFLAGMGGSPSSSQPGPQEAAPLLTVCVQQLLHALMPAVIRQSAEFAAQDFAVVLHSLANLQQQAQHATHPYRRRLGLPCSWEWLQQVLPAVQVRLPEATARTQVTILWAAARLLRSLQLQQPQQQCFKHHGTQEQQSQEWGQTQQPVVGAPPPIWHPPKQLPPRPTSDVKQPYTGAQQSSSSLMQQTHSTSQQLYRPAGTAPVLVKPHWQVASHQRMTQLQQQQQQQQQQPELPAGVLPTLSRHSDLAEASTGADPCDYMVASDTPTVSPAVKAHADGGVTPVPSDCVVVGATAELETVSAWLAFLESFYAVSLSQLPAYSAEDLVVTCCTVALQRQVPPVTYYEQLLSAIHQQLPNMNMRQVSGVAWALGRIALLPCRHNPHASLVPVQPWLSQLYLCTNQTLTACAAAAAAASGSAHGDACSTHAHESGSCSSTVVYRAAEVVRLMWAAAVCDFNPGDSWWTSAEQVLLCAAPVDSTRGSTNRDPGTSMRAMSQQGPNGQQQVQAAISQLPTRLTGALLQAYAAARRPPPDSLLRAVLTPAVACCLSDEPVINTLRLLRGLAHTRSRAPQQWLQQLARGYLNRLSALSVEELHQLLVCFASVGLQVHHSERVIRPPLTATFNAPCNKLGACTSTTSDSSNGDGGSHDSSTAAIGTAWSSAVAAACVQHLRPGCSNARDVSQLLWAAAKLQLVLPGECLQALLLHMQTCFLQASCTSLAVCIDAITRLAVLPDGNWLGGFLMATHRSCTATAAAIASREGLSSTISSMRARQTLVVVILQTLQGLARVKSKLPAKWLKQQLLLLHAQLAVLQPRDVANLMLLLARLQCRPSPMYLHSVLRQLGDYSSCSALDLVHIIYGVASLRWCPSKQWTQLFLTASTQKLSQMSNQGLAMVHWSLAVTRVIPPALTWRFAAIQAVSARLGQLDTLQLSMIVWAWGRMQVHLTPLDTAGGELVARQQDQQQDTAAPQHTQASLLFTMNRPATLDGISQVGSQAVRAQQYRTGPGEMGGSVGDVCEASDCIQHDFQTFSWEQRKMVAQQLLEAALQRQGEYTAVQLCHLLAGLAKMRLQPSQSWLHAMVRQGSKQRLSVLDGYQMQQLLWALARLRYRAAAQWVQDMELLLETKWQQHASTRHSAAWAVRQLEQLARDVVVVPEVASTGLGSATADHGSAGG